MATNPGQPLAAGRRRRAAASPDDPAPAVVSSGAMTTGPAEGADSIGEARECPDQAAGRRRMPDYVARCLVRLQGGRVYLPAAQRLVWFRDECPDWGIETRMLEGGQEAGFATVQAVVTSEAGRVVATGIKTETRQDFPAGWVEKAETGAIARALAVAGFGTQFAPEMDEPAPADSPQLGVRYGAPAGVEAVRLSEVWPGPGQCPRCHAPEGKRHLRPCSG
ncbi:MAG TPA: hypothetical protein VLH79_01740 [Chthonomonadales bacterium]|nr:hypothetical protein [Chthonomonadales bacterium]